MEYRVKAINIFHFLTAFKYMYQFVKEFRLHQVSGFQCQFLEKITKTTTWAKCCKTKKLSYQKPVFGKN